MQLQHHNGDNDGDDAVAEALADGRLIDAMPDVRPVPDPISAVYAKARHPSKKIGAAVTHLRTALHGGPPWEQMLRQKV